MNLGVDPRHADQMVRCVVNLPHGTGKSVRVAVFAAGDKAAEATEAGADVVGSDDLAEMVQKGDINFDRCIATPDMMPIVPKLGTVTQDVATAVKNAKGGQVEYRVEKAGIIHAGVGKASFQEDALAENIRTLVDAVSKARPSGAKGTYIKRISLSSTMGPGLKLDVASALASDANA